MANMMRSIVFFMMLFSNIAATDKSHLRVYVALYCPLEKHWTYTAEMWENDADEGSNDDSSNTKYITKTSGGTNQLQAFDMDAEVDDGQDRSSIAEIEIRIEHDCNIQNTKENLRLWEELKIPLGKGDTYAFKALHLTQPK